MERFCFGNGDGYTIMWYHSFFIFFIFSVQGVAGAKMDTRFSADPKYKLDIFIFIFPMNSCPDIIMPS